MVDKRLVNWIKENQKKGYDMNELKNILIKNGNNPQRIENAINNIRGKKDLPIKKKISRKKLPKKKINQSKTFQAQPTFTKKTLKKKLPIKKKISRKKLPKKKSFFNVNYSAPKKTIKKKTPINTNSQRNFKTQKINKNKTKKKFNKKYLLFIGVGLGLLLLISLLVYAVMNYSSNKISQEDFSSGTNFELKQDKEITFTSDNIKHNIKLNSISSDSASLIIQSNPIQVSLDINEEKKIDLDSDDYYDLIIRLEGINNDVAIFYIRETNEIACEEDWECGNWSECLETNKQIRNCTDLNECGTTEDKPSLSQYCEYETNCTEDWECGNWSECTNGTKTRNCTDLNECDETQGEQLITEDCTIEQENDTTNCTEDWNCSEWSICENGNQTRDCVDLNECGTTEDKPGEAQSCEEEVPLEYSIESRIMQDNEENTYNITGNFSSIETIELEPDLTRNVTEFLMNDTLLEGTKNITKNFQMINFSNNTDETIKKNLSINYSQSPDHIYAYYPEDENFFEIGFTTKDTMVEFEIDSKDISIMPTIIQSI